MKRYIVGPLQIDPEQRVLYRGSDVIALSPKAFDILLVLVENAGQVVSRDNIRERVWQDLFIEEANISNNISLLRGILRDHLDDPIKTLSKRGYQFTANVSIDQQTATTVHPSTQTPQQTALTREREEHPQPLAQQALPAATPHGPLFSKTHWLLTALAMLVLLSAGAAIEHWRKTPAQQVQASIRPSLAILTFRNLSTQADDDWMGTALQETLGADLTNDNGIRLISADRAYQMQQDLSRSPTQALDNQAIQAIGKSLDCDLVLLGSYLPVEDKVRIDLHLRNSRTGASIGEFSQIVPHNSFLQVVASASSGFRRSIGLPVANTLSLDIAVSDSQDGMRDYADGLRLYHEDKAAEAQVSLSKAVIASPLSPLPHSALATVWSQLGFDKKAAAEAHLALTTSASLPKEQKLALQARAYECLTDWPHALDTYTTLRHLYPDDLDYALGVANADMESAKSRQALEMLAALRVSSPTANSDPRMSLAQSDAAFHLSEFHAALLYAGETIQLAHAKSERHLEANALIDQGWAWSYMGDDPRGLADAQKAADISTQINNLRDLSLALSAVGQIQRALDIPAAEATLFRAYDIAQKVGARNSMVNLLIALGNVRSDAEDWEGARNNYQRSLDIATEMNSPRKQTVPIECLGGIAENADDLEAERSYDSRLLAITQPAGDTGHQTVALIALAHIESWQGNLAAARGYIQQSLDIAQRTGDREEVEILLEKRIELQMQAGDLSAARQTTDHAKSMHPTDDTIKTDLQLWDAALTLEEGHPESVDSPMTVLATTSTPTHTYPGAMAWRLIAESWLARGDLPKARIAIEKGLPLARKSPNVMAYLIPDSLLSARLDAAEGHTAKASIELASLLTQAQRLKDVELQLQIRLAQGQMQKQHGDAASATRTLQAVQTEAAQHGFALIAQKAHKALS